MSEIEVAAISFIRARRLKINAKTARNNLLSQCESRGENHLCVVVTGMEWCEACVESQPHHKEFKKQSILSAAALRKLERIVNREDGGKEK
jgi:hypothetical protein